MHRTLKTPIRTTVPPHVPRMARPYLQLDSELDATGRSVDHTIRPILSRGEYVAGSPEGTFMWQVEGMVSAPRRMIWLPRVVKLAMMPGAIFGEPNRQVLQAFSNIPGIKHEIDLCDVRYHEFEDAYVIEVERGSVAVEIEENGNEMMRYRVSKVGLAAAGLRLAAATTVMDATQLHNRLGNEH